MLPPLLVIPFPNLESDGGAVSHPADPGYNCVAWAVGVTDAMWWPADPDAFWPPSAPDELTVDAFIAALATVGYAPCGDGGFTAGFEKVAIYARDGEPTHVARQMADGTWSSKLGRDCTVSHGSPCGVEGPVYGSAIAILQRSIT